MHSRTRKASRIATLSPWYVEALLLAISLKVDRLLIAKLAVAMETFQVESCVRCHHIYKVGWSPSLGEVLQCTRELEKHQGSLRCRRGT